jgi:hypothetical protein
MSSLALQEITMKTQTPNCPAHLGRPMKLVGKIERTTFKGTKTVSGFRYRCSVERCPFVETVLLEEENKPSARVFPQQIKKSKWPVTSGSCQGKK